jgi:phage terminase large subunit-like protein
LSAQAEAGNVKLVRGPWNDEYLNELQNFDGSDGCVADQVDASSGAFHMLTNFKRAGVW